MGRFSIGPSVYTFPPLRAQEPARQSLDPASLPGWLLGTQGGDVWIVDVLTYGLTEGKSPILQDFVPYRAAAQKGVIRWSIGSASIITSWIDARLFPSREQSIMILQAPCAISTSLLLPLPNSMQPMTICLRPCFILNSELVSLQLIMNVDLFLSYHISISISFSILSV